MQKIRNYKKFGMGVACLLTAGTVAFSNIGIVTAAEPQDSNPQTVAEKTEPEKAPKGIFGNGTSGIRKAVPGLHQLVPVRSQEMIRRFLMV